MLILAWFQRSLHPTQVNWQSCPWPLKLITSRAAEGTWIRAGGYETKGLKRIVKKWRKITQNIKNNINLQSKLPLHSFLHWCVNSDGYAINIFSFNKIKLSNNKRHQIGRHTGWLGKLDHLKGTIIRVTCFFYYILKIKLYNVLDIMRAVIGRCLWSMSVDNGARKANNGLEDFNCTVLYCT